MSLLLPTVRLFYERMLDPFNVTFDGYNKLIIINEGVTSISIKTDVYSTWKRWMIERKNAGWTQAISTVGGQSLPGGGFLGDTYFLENGWKIKLTGTVEITGNIFTADATSPFVTAEGIQIARSTVSQLVQTTVPDDYSQNISNVVWQNQPDNSATIAQAVWQEPTASHGSPNTTMGYHLTKNVLTTKRFISLS